MFLVVVEEYRKKQKKSQLKFNLKYFLETGYKMQKHNTRKVRKHNMDSIYTLST